MAQILIEVGSWFLLEEMPTRIIEKKNNLFIMMNNKGQTIIKTLEQMEELFSEGHISSPLPKNSYFPKNGKSKNTVSMIGISKENEEKAVLKRKLIRKIEGIPFNRAIVEVIIENFFNKHENCLLKKPSPITLYRWKIKWQQSNHDVSGLLDTPGRGEYNRWRSQSVAICTEAIDFIYMNRMQNTIQQTLNYALDLTRVANENKLPGTEDLRKPTRWIIQKLVNEIHAIDRNIARYGIAKARNLHRGKSEKVEEVKFRQFAEFDATPINTVLLDNHTNALLGRGWITVLKERVTKYPLGIYIGYTPPSCLTVAACLKHSMLPKTSLAFDYPNLENSWDGYGVVESIIMDNALENHARPIESMIAMLNIDIVLCGKKSPWQKPNIEGFLKIVANDAMNIIDGTTFNNIFDKGDYESEKYAVMTINEFRSHIMKWLVDVYMQKPQAALNGVSPATMWRLLNEKQYPIFETRALELDLVLGRVESKTITQNGFVWKKLKYVSEELTNLREIHNHNFSTEIRINELDISHISVQKPGTKGVDPRDFIQVPAFNQDYTRNLTAYLHSINQAWARKHYYQEDDTGWLKASAEIYNVISSLPKVRNKINAKSASRLLDSINPKNLKSITPPIIQDIKIERPKVYFPDIDDADLSDFDVILNKGEDDADN